MNQKVWCGSFPKRKGALRVLLGMMVCAMVGLRSVPAPAQITDVQVDALVEALRLAAPNTGVKNDGFFTEWKIKEENILRWSKRCTGQVVTPAQLEADPGKTREILRCVMGKILREQYEVCRVESEAIRRAASWWMTGDPGRFDSPETRSYTEKVLSFCREAP